MNVTQPFAPLPEAGDTLDRYELTRKLGAGGMGAVFEGVDRSAGLVRAIKIIPGRSDPELQERFVREGRAMARVPRHPHVVQVMHGGETEACKFLVLEFAPGGDLHQRVTDRPVSPEQAARWARDLADGLAHVHAHGVLHRDLKPANVVFDAEGRAKLTDFGLAAVADTQSLTESGTLMGTPAYMAPEQALCEAVDRRTDVYGLGAILYFMLTGRAPVEAASTLVVLSKVAEGDVVRPKERNPEVPDGLDAICRRAMATAPEDRYADAEALSRDLSRWLQTPAEARARGSRRAPAAVAAVAAVIGGIVMTRTIGDPPTTDPTASAAIAPTPSTAATPQPASSSEPPPTNDPLDRIRREILAKRSVVENYQALKALVRDRPTHVEAWIFLSRTSLALGLSAPGRDAAIEAIEASPNDPRGYALLARGWLAANKPAEARDALSRTAGSRHPWCRGVRWILAVRERTQNTSEGLALAKEFPKVGFISIALGLLYLRTNALKSAVRFLEQGLEVQPNSVPGLLAAAGLRIEYEQYQEAYAHVLHVRALRGELPHVVFFEGLLQARGTDPGQALEVADRLAASLARTGAGRFKGQREWVEYLRGAAQYGLEAYDLAIGHLRRAVKLSPGNNLARRDLARSCFRAGRVLEGLRLAEELLEGTHPAAHLLMAWGLELSGQFERAQAAVDRYTELGGPEVLDELWIRWRLGRRRRDRKAVRAALKRIEARRPHAEAVLRGWVIVHADEGDWAAARRALQLYKRNRPDSALLKETARYVAERRTWPR